MLDYIKVMAFWSSKDTFWEVKKQTKEKIFIKYFIKR